MNENEIRQEERKKVGKAMAALMRAHPYEYPRDYADLTEQIISDGSIFEYLDGVNK